MARLTSQLVISLIDRVTAPARQVAGTVDRLTAASRKNVEQLGAMRGRMFGAVAAGYALGHALGAPIKAAGDFQEQLDGIRQKADLTSRQLEEVGRTARKVGVATGQGAGEIAKSIDFLVGMGASTDQAEKAADPIARAATAYNAATEELSSSVYALFSNLKVPAEQTAKAIDIMAQAGKEGGFELKDMAKEFPAVTASAQALGITGTKGVADLTAALEVARLGAANGAEAANNMRNFMAKIVSKETLKNFRKFGVDVPKELAKAAKKGESPIEHMLGVIDKITKGGRPELMAQLFSDMQVQQFIRPLLANMQLYRDIREKALAASGVVEKDFQKRLQTYAGRMMLFNAQLQDMAIAIGNALLPGLTKAMAALTPFITAIGDVADRFPRATAAIISAIAGLIGLRVAAIGVRWAFLFMKGGVLSVGLAAAKTAELVVGVTKRMRLAILGATMLGEVGGGGIFAGLLAGLSGAAGSIIAVAGTIGGAIAAITAPVWGLIIAVVGVAVAIHRYWEPISDFCSGFVSGVTEAVEPLVTYLGNLGSRILSAVGTWIGNKVIDIAAWLGIDPATLQAMVKSAGDIILALPRAISSAMRNLPGEIGNWFANIFSIKDYSATAEASFRNAGVSAGKALVEAIENAFDSLFAWLKGLPGRIASAIGSIDIGSLIHWPTPPAWLSRLWGGGASAAPAPHPAIAGARAAGGPVARGMTYLVGEEGPELFTAPGNGMVHDAATTAAAMAPAVGAAGSRGTAGAVSIRFGDIVLSIAGVSDPEKIADKLVPVLQRRIEAALSGGQFDSNYAAGL